MKSHFPIKRCSTRKQLRLPRISILNNRVNPLYPNGSSDSFRLQSPVSETKNHPADVGWFFVGADGGIRTPDPFITSEVLCQLSYISTILHWVNGGGERSRTAVRRHRHVGFSERSRRIQISLIELPDDRRSDEPAAFISLPGRQRVRSASPLQL